MNAEQIASGVASDLAARARIYAALGDPTRLAIVDQLHHGDVSPQDLARRLAVAPNLLMHHLRVLETSGVVRRVVSEGDRRRSYVQVVVGAIDAAQAPRPVWEATRILFVCTRNSARSVLAAALWAQTSDVPATSAGTDPAPEVHPMAVRAARRHNVGRTPPLDDVVSLARPSHVRDVAQPGDLVVSTCDTAREALVSGAPPSLHWSVADPVRVGTDAAFDVAIHDLSWRVTRLAAVVTPPVT